MADIDKIEKRFNIRSLTENQKKAVNGAVIGKDVFVGTKTGSGKSLTYEAIPCVSEKIVVIVAPLISIMQEQCTKLNQLGFKATYVGKDTQENELLTQGHFDFVYGSPELLVGEKQWRDMVQNETYQSRLGTIVVDEAHTVLQWGETNYNDEPFRKWFSKIGELRSLCPQANLVALTATAGPTQRRLIMKQLSFRMHNCVTILDSPDRLNIKITSSCVPNKSEAHDNLKWLIETIQTKREKTSRYVIFCRTITDCSKVYGAFAQVLGRNTGLFEMYHSKTKDSKKEEIRSNMACESKLRLLICTNAAGMGVNFHGVNDIIHFGLPYEMDTFVQQMGRAGRDGSSAHELVLYKAHKGQIKKVDSELVKLVKESTCRHKTLCDSYCSTHETITPKHKCCDVCEETCECGSEECPGKHVITANIGDTDEEEDTSDVFEREVTDDQKQLLHHKLQSYMFKLFTTTTVINPEIVHGINEDVIKAVVKKCNHLFTPDDVLAELPIWSYSCAKDICGIINDVFGDIDMYELELEDANADSSTCSSDSDKDSD